ncbi:MAG: TerC family protein [Acidimicrobiia bacterium]|nr:TerC family protein [Acidimicrobiia bacterium]
MIAAVRFVAETSTSDFSSFSVPLWAWVAFLATISVLLLADLLLLHREEHVISVKEAAIESAVWISIGVSFTFVVWGAWGGEAAGEYISAYLIEKSLSVDNVFVWAVILQYFAVPAAYQFRVLFWGVFGALVMRFFFILVGVELVERFEWVLLLFGGFLIFTAVRLMQHSEEEAHPENNPMLKFIQRRVPSTTEYHGQSLFTVVNGKRLATPLFSVLVVIETTDLIFALDSIPAVLGVSESAFIIFSSNAFAILGLRALYFVLAGAREKFRYLQPGLAVILALVGMKMLVSPWYHVPIGVSLGAIVLVLTVSMIASITFDRPDGDGPGDALDDQLGEGQGLVGGEPTPEV